MWIVYLLIEGGEHYVTTREGECMDEPIISYFFEMWTFGSIILSGDQLCLKKKV